ncbi:MAG: SurA N-terminal domain-containing protein [Bacteroidales bacterium]|nr:MAG: SurA N-terminal domain-containing protein [Bacteroidales bacterium]
MATLQTIRDRAGVLIAVIIGLALLAFVLGDFFGQGSGLTFRSKRIFEIAEINGKSISYQSFDEKIQNLTEVYRITGQSNIDETMVENIREQTWQQLIREYVLEKELDNLGVMVSADEMFDLVQGADPHPYIRQLFTDPQTGMLNRAGLMQFLKTLDNDPAQRAYWLFLENEILQDREFSKYNNLIRQGLFVTGFEGELENLYSSRKVSFNYIVQRFNTIPDSAITLSEDDLEKYYREHRNDYKQTASRNIEYISFEVLPSASDTKAAEDWIKNISQEFSETEDIEQFVNLSSDIPFDNRNYKIEAVPEILRDFVASSEIGDVYGPYFENEAYKLARVSEVNYLPDSVHARHILIVPSQDKTYEQAEIEADSIKNLIENGTDFGLLAMLNSEDPGSSQLGGDLGWFQEGMMVQPFNDACFEGKTGDITVVESQFGFHIIEILDQGPQVKKFKIGILERTVEPSSSTYQAIYSEASRFAGTNTTYERFNQTITDQQLEKRLANDLKIDDKIIPGLDSPRPLIRAVFETGEGEIVLDFNDQAVFELGNKFIIAYVTSVKEEGIAPLNQVRTDVELNVRKEKKAERIAESLQEQLAIAGTLEGLAENLEISVQEATDITFNSFSIPGAGIEPAVIATAVNLDQDIISSPIQGANGIYLIQVYSVEESGEDDFASVKIRLSSNIRARANYEAFEALKKAANIVDSRSKFY